MEHVTCQFPEYFHKPRNYAVNWKQLLYSNKSNTLRWVVLGLLQDGVCTDFIENLRREYIKARPVDWYHFQPTSFLIGLYQSTNTICAATLADTLWTT